MFLSDPFSKKFGIALVIICSLAGSAIAEDWESEVQGLRVDELFAYPPSLELARAAVKQPWRVPRLCAAEPDLIDLQGRFGITPLIWATLQGAKPGVVALLEAGADPELATDQGRTALDISVQQDRPAIMADLLTFGAEHRSLESSGASLLITASRRGLTTAVRLLLQVGTDIDATDNLGMTALHHAVHADERDLVRLLIRHGARFDLPDWLGLTPRDYADGSSNPDLMELFR